MEHAEGLTKKGIPVIDEEGEQQAEIEHSEIIFTLEVTKKLEEYYQIFYSEESTNKEKEHNVWLCSFFNKRKIYILFWWSNNRLCCN